MKNNPVFIVEGDHEKLFLQSICKGKKIITLRFNGKDVCLEAIAEKIKSHCNILHGKYHPIIVVFDRENRALSSEKISKQLLEILKTKEVTDEIIVGVPDRMIENWILADPDCIKSLYPEINLTDFENPDGFNGKGKLTKILGNYHETTDGVDLLKKINPSNMRRSKSFSYFIDQCIEIDCWWIKN